MKNLTIALSLILSLGIFGCGDEDSASTPSSETVDENSASTPSNEATDENSASTPSNEATDENSASTPSNEATDEISEPTPSNETVTGSAPGPVTTELPSNDPTRFCRGVSSWDEVTEDSGDVFCIPVPTRPSSQEPIIGCTGTVTSQAQVDSVRDCTVLNGSIDFHRSDVTMINLPLLEQITGKVLLEDNDSLTNLLLPALTSIGASFVVRSNGVTEISLPALKSIGGSVDFTENYTLTDIALPVLTTIDSMVYIEYNEALAEISLPSLTTIMYGLYITDDDALTEFSLPLLTTVGGKIRISYNDELTDISIPTLTSVDNDENDSDYIFLNRYLTNCDLGSYTDQYCP